ncbi:MAG: hypothetical protein M0Z96_04730 [Actinomycetota bacterium]|nr:hypothetical protein [Actinomycetota bacterium]
MSIPNTTTTKIWPELIAAVGLLAIGLTFRLSTNVGSRSTHHLQPEIPTLSPNNPPLNSAATSTTTSSSTTTTTTTPAPTEPGGGYTLIPGRRIVAFYGAPGGGGLGVLGQNSPETMWPKLMTQAAPYQQTTIPILPAYELITFIAQGSPQPNGTYSARLSNQVIQQYLNVVREHQGLLILDIQPGRGNFLADAQTLTPFLSQPDVALALDPEWQVNSTQLPGQVIGTTTADEINKVSNWLEQLVISNHLPQKLLLIHQFSTSMIQDKASISSRPDLAIVFNMDGFGSWKAKTESYQMLATDPSFPLGFKLFYRQDVPLEEPSQVMGLQPQPVVIEYE